jgi:hypothetical protein
MGAPRPRARTPGHGRRAPERLRYRRWHAHRSRRIEAAADTRNGPRHRCSLDKRTLPPAPSSRARDELQAHPGARSAPAPLLFRRQGSSARSAIEFHAAEQRPAAHLASRGTTPQPATKVSGVAHTCSTTYALALAAVVQDTESARRRNTHPAHPEFARAGTRKVRRANTAPISAQAPTATLGSAMRSEPFRTLAGVVGSTALATLIRKRSQVRVLDRPSYERPA